VRVRVECPAKLNLFLAVGPPDARAYHPIRSIFQAIDLSDTLHIEKADETRITCDWPDLPAENTVSKALRFVAELMNVPPLRIHIEKRIPVQAGLGGGSSNAAGFLRAIDLFLEAPLREHDRFSIAAAVGADVPFFLVGGRAKAEGYGEKLTPLPDPPTEWYVVAKPDVGCDTGLMYRRLDGQAYEWRDFPGLPDPLQPYNDFERVAPCECLELIERLQVHGATAAGLSGSGSAVYGRFLSCEAAEQGRERLLDESRAAAWVARSLARAESLAVERLA
jgi:4-diphosphocytidyl-2-C-methyl-D-erythritol kinase